MKTQGSAELFVKHGLLSMLGSLSLAINTFGEAVLIGQLSGAQSLAAVSICIPIIFLIGGIGQVVIRGSVSLLAESLGSSEESTVRQVLPGFIIWSLFFTSVSATIVALLAPQLLHYISPHDSTLVELALPYLRIQVFNQIPMTLSVGFIGFLRCLGDSRSVAYLFAGYTFLNLALHALFLHYFEWGTAGAASAAMTACSVLLIASWLKLNSSCIGSGLRNLAFQANIIRPIVQRGNYVLVLQILTFLQHTLIYKIAGEFQNSQLVATLGATLNTHAFMYTLVAGLSLSFQAWAGIAFGSNDGKRLRDLLKTYLLLTSCLFGVLSALLIVFSNQLLYNFVKDPAIVEALRNEFRIGVSGTIFFGPTIIIVFFLQAINHLKTVFAFLVIRSVMQVALTLVLTHSAGVGGLVWSLLLSEALALMMAGILLVRGLRKIRLK
jgi:Na+-driven multidrug efflux pump